MQVKMAATHGICIGFLVLVLCLSHGSWSGSARSMLSESKRELSEESNHAANEPTPPEDLSVKENSNVPLEVVQGSASPISLGDSDQSACGWIPCGTPDCHPNSCHAHECVAPIPRPFCGNPSRGLVPLCRPYWTYYPPQASPECQPTSSPCPLFNPSQPNPADCHPLTTPCPSSYPPQPIPGCQPLTAPCNSFYPPQPNPECYAPYPGCHTTPIPYPYPRCQPASTPYPAPDYEPQPIPGCFNPGCAYPPQSYAPQPNPECLNPNPECVYPPNWAPHPNPGCLNPECQPADSGSAYPPQPSPWCLSPGCLNYPPQLDPNHPTLPEPFYPPQQEPSYPSPSTGPRMNEEQNSLKQDNNGSTQSNDVEIVPADKVKQDGSINEQHGSHPITPNTT